MWLYFGSSIDVNEFDLFFSLGKQSRSWLCREERESPCGKETRNIGDVTYTYVYLRRKVVISIE